MNIFLFGFLFKSIKPFAGVMVLVYLEIFKIIDISDYKSVIYGTIFASVFIKIIIIVYSTLYRRSLFRFIKLCHLSNYPNQYVI